MMILNFIYFHLFYGGLGRRRAGDGGVRSGGVGRAGAGPGGVDGLIVYSIFISYL